MNHRTVRKALAGGVAGAALLVVGIGPAAAHVGTSVDEVAAGSTTALGLTIGHGCDDSDTTAVAVQIPEGVNEAQAFAKPGWTVEHESEDLPEPVEGAHAEITERVATITFTAEPGNALPHDLRDTFTINFTAPDAEGETLFFKTIQTCEVGENRWIDEFDGEGEEPESPAPAIAVAAAAAEEDGHDDGAASETTETTETSGHEDAAAATEAASDSDRDHESSSDTLSIVALVVGALGLIVGGVALSRSRKAPAT